MKKTLIKLSLIAGLAILPALSSKALFTFSLTINAGTSTNLFPAFNNPIKVVSATIASGSTSQGTVAIYDTATNTVQQTGVPLWTYTNAPYTNITFYMTNYFVQYNNFYGVASSSPTNIAMIDITNSVPVLTNYWPLPLTLQAGTNNTVNYVGIAALYNHGMWGTNYGTGPATITITYQ